MRLDNIFKLVIAVGVSEAAGIIGAIFTVSAIPTWYATLAKPALNPPAWIFGPVWTTLYFLMGISLFLIWKRYSLICADRRIARIWKIGIGLFIFQLVLNVFWSIIFFGWHNPGWAFVEIIFLWLVILATIIMFAKTYRSAAWLLAPYIIWVSFAGYLNFSIWQMNSSASTGQVACTQEAKLCPDGSAVGRTGPNCEFDACPTEVGDNIWKTITDSKAGITFQYPVHLLTEYIHTVDWPPKVQVLNEPFSCNETSSETAMTRKTEKRMVDNRVYCITKESEGAAGSIYTNYIYVFPIDAPPSLEGFGRASKTIVFTFILQAVQCANYDEPRKTACEKERSLFDMDGTVDRMARSTVLF